MKILMWTPIRRELEAFENFLDRKDLILLDAAGAIGIMAAAVAEHPHLILLDEAMEGGALPIIRRLRASAASGPAPRFIVRTERSSRPPADGVVAIPRCEGMAEVLAAMTRLLAVPVRATTRAYSLIEARGRAAGEKLYDATILDISVGGLKLRTTQPLRVGESVSLSFMLEAGDPLVIAGGRVVRDAGLDGPMRLYGVELTDLRAEDRQAISHFVERALLAARARQASGATAAAVPA